MRSARYASAAATISVACALVLAVARPARAWLLHEHVRVGWRGIGAMEPTARLTLARAWARVAARRELPRLCERLSERYPDRELRSGEEECISFPALAALAADHSCSPAELAHIVAHEGWALDVLREASGRARNLSAAQPSVELRVDQRRQHDVALQSVDPDYAKHAASGVSHFMLARTGDGLTTYLRNALATGQTANAAALYVNYHAAALGFARDGRSLWRALVTEAYALHFLEDAFSAGHFVGSWGEEPERMGTHDYYCRHGVEVRSWDGASEYAAHGDAFLTDTDADHAAVAIALSLEQLAEVLSGQSSAALANEGAHVNLEAVRTIVTSPDHGSCSSEPIPFGLEPLAEYGFIAAIFAHTPRPSRISPELPRFRNELGPFVGASLTVDGGFVARFHPGGDFAGGASITRGRFGLGFGVGTEGILSRYLDGRLLVEALFAAERIGDRAPALGIGIHLRAPFYYVPGDWLVWIVPFLLRESWGLDAARVAASGRKAWGIGLYRLLLLSEDVTLRLGIGRDVTFLLTWEGAEQGGAPTRARWQFLVPIATLTVGRAYSGPLASELDIDLGVDVGGTEGLGMHVGPYLAIGGGTRIYP